MKNMTREQARMLGDALGNEYNKEGLMRFADMLFGMVNAPFADAMAKEAKPAQRAETPVEVAMKSETKKAK